MDDPVLVSALVDHVRATTGAYLNASAKRLTRYSHLLGGFSEAVAAWEDRRVPNARQITEKVNELFIAKRFLQDPLCRHLEYEPPVPGTGKTIDFLFHTTDRNRIFYDVKTVCPDDRDALGRYEKAKREGWFTPGTELVLAGEWSGELAHHQFASREKFLDHTLELEEKIRLIPDGQDGRTYFRMVLCSDGFRWRRDQLEDFAETYLTGYNSWDHFAAMETHFLKEKGRRLDRTIHGFCYFERGPCVPEPVEFRCDVRVPRADS